MASNIATGSLSIIPPDQPVSVFNSGSSSAGGATGGALFYTVPTGKTFYWQGFWIQLSSTAPKTFRINANGAQQISITLSASNQIQTLEANLLNAFPAGTELKIYEAGSSSVQLMIWGFLL
jgi:hypothetical protein